MKKGVSVLILICVLLTLCSCRSKADRWQEQYDLGIRYLSEGNYQEAVISFTAAIEIDEKQAPAYAGRADAYLGSADYDNAIIDYRSAIDKQPDSTDYYIHLSDAYLAKGDIDSGIKALEEGYAATESAELQEHIESIENFGDFTGNVFAWNGTEQGLPIANARVTLKTKNSDVAISFLTDASGGYSGYVIADEYEFFVYADDYQSLSFSQVISPKESTLIEAIYLLSEEDAGSGNVSGSVSFNLSGEPITQAEVFVIPGWNQAVGNDVQMYQTSTDSTGKYTIENLPVGHYTLYANFGDSFSEQQNIVVSGMKKKDWNIYFDYQATVDDFNSFLELFERTRYAWGLENVADVSLLDVSEIIDNYIIAYPYYEAGLYYYYDCKPIIRADLYSEIIEDPKHMFEWGAVIYDASGVDWIIQNVFGAKTDTTSETEYHYYFDDALYVRERLGIGGPDMGLAKRVTSEKHQKLAGDTYEIVIHDQEFWYRNIEPSTVDVTNWFYVFTVVLKYDSDHGYYWGIQSYERTQNSPDDMIVNLDMAMQTYSIILDLFPKTHESSWQSGGETYTFSDDAYYTLYDIDKNGIPELLIDDAEWSSQYYVYTCGDGGALLCGEILAYPNGLFEYEENGMIVHYGGRGYLHYEAVSLYKLADNELTHAEILSSFGTDSYQEIRGYLNGCTTIDDWWLLDDNEGLLAYQEF